jgi:2,3-bisphosphoglycerate-independent phosphoglycerate mutase
MVHIFGQVVSERGLKQFRCAETEKFPHVTFFFNDYRDEPFPGEDRKIVDSPRDVTTYDQKPEMSAPGVTAAMLKAIESDAFDAIILNYANGDMVGHTGNLQAAIKAVETVDACVGQIVQAVQKKGGSLIVTADHGNCEQMIDPVSKRPHTSHTTYDVEAILVDDGLKGAKLHTGGRLADLMPSALAMMGLDKPNEMAGQSLIA